MTTPTPPPTTEHANTWGNNIAKITFLSLTILLFLTAVYLVRGELDAIILGILLGTILAPMHRHVLRITQKVNTFFRRVFRIRPPKDAEQLRLYEAKVSDQVRWHAAIVSVTLAFLIIVIPLGLFLIQIAKQGVSTLQTTANWLDRELPKKVPRLIEEINNHELSRRIFHDLQLFTVTAETEVNDQTINQLLPLVPEVAKTTALSAPEPQSSDGAEEDENNAADLEDQETPATESENETTSQPTVTATTPREAIPQESPAGADVSLDDKDDSAPLRQPEATFSTSPKERITPKIDPQRATEFLTNVSRNLLTEILKILFAVISKTWVTVFNFFLMFFVMFFVFYDGENIMNYVRSISPLGPKEEQQLLQQIKAVSSTLVVSILGTASCQAMVAMVIFWIVDIPALFWGVMLGMCSIIPFVGTTLIWVPITIYFFATGQTWQACFVLATCAIIVANLDNFLRPLLMKKSGKTGMSYLALFFAILGGLQTFGLIGIIYGPLIFGLCAICLLIFRTQFKKKTQ
ncbi:MAG: AI-2E family transporter [Victivallales bacterium]|nr:AI-2E family transporter [Victivallales bacterium]